MEKFKVNVHSDDLGVLPDEDFLMESAKAAGWSDDPGTGKAILVPDVRGAPAYEVVSPVPMAPPIGWTPTPPIEELIRQTVKREFERFDDLEVDDINEAEDFDVPDEVIPVETIYEFIAMEPQAPEPKAIPLEERAKAQVEYDQEYERQKRIAIARSRAEYDRRVKEAQALYGDPPPRPAPVEGDEGA